MCCDTGKDCAANKISSVLAWNRQHKLHYRHVCTRDIKGHMVVIKKKKQVSRETIKQPPGLQKHCWRCPLTNTIDQTGQSQHLQALVALGPSQTGARKCFVTFCGCWSLFSSLTVLFSAFSVRLITFHNMLLLTPALGAAACPPPPGQLGKMYVYFVRYTFGNTITL